MGFISSYLVARAIIRTIDTANKSQQDNPHLNKHALLGVGLFVVPIVLTFLGLNYYLVGLLWIAYFWWITGIARKDIAKR